MKHQSAIKRFFLHIHPAKVDERAVKFSRTFGLGGISAILIIILFVSGLLLRFSYIPTPEKAYDSVLFLQNNILFGRLLRNIHHIAAKLLIVASFLHLVRVYFTQSVYGNRAKNWIYGMVIMFMVLFMNFTGYLLPWDQLSYWAVTIMTSMLEYIPFVGKFLADMFRGGDVVDGTTLLNFYNLHTGIIPLFVVFLLCIHFWLIRKSKGIALEPIEKKQMVDTYSNLVTKEIIVALLVVIVVFVVSIFYNAPLLEKASISVSPNPSKAPWYFMGAQELLLHVHPVVAVFFIPVFIIGLFCSLPYISYNRINTGVWFNSLKGKRFAVASSIFAVCLTVFAIIISDFIFRKEEWFVNLPVVISDILMPLLVYIIPLFLFVFIYKKKKRLERLELVIGLVTIIITSYIVMMLVGIWFRGEGMNLIFVL